MLMSSAAPASHDEWKELGSVQHLHPILGLGVHRTQPTSFYTASQSVNRVDRDYALTTIVPSNRTGVRSLQVSLDGRVAVARGSTVEIWRGSEMVGVLGHDADVSSLSWEGSLLASSADFSVYLWDTDRNTCIKRLQFESLMQSVAVSPNENLILAHSTRDFYVWSPDAESVGQRFSVPTSAAMTCAWLGQTRAMIGCMDGTCFIIPVGAAQPSLSMFGHTKNVRSVHMSRDEKRGVSASWDCSLRIWCLETGQPLRVLSQVHESYVTAGRFFGSDDSHLVSASSDKTLRVFDLYQGDRDRLLSFVGRARKGHAHGLPTEVLRQVKSMLFGSSQVT